MEKKIGIFGGLGFIGRHLVDFFRYDCYKYDYWKDVSTICIFKKDMNDLDSVIESVKGLDLIFHFSGKSRGEKIGDVFRNNVFSTANLILACNLLKINPKIVFLSSKQVLYNKFSEYSIAKSVEEKMIEDFFDKRFILRPPGIFGPRQRPNYNSFISTMAYSIANDLEYTIDFPEKKIELIHVKSFIKAIMGFDLDTSKIFNFCGDFYSLGEIEKKFLEYKQEGCLEDNFGETLSFYLNEKRRLS